jgi:hypothetical protein
MKNLFLLFTIVLMSCDPKVDERGEIINNTNDTIYYVLEYKNTFTYNSPPTKNNELCYSCELFLFPKKKSRIIGKALFTRWEGYFSNSKDGKIRIFIFNTKLLQNNKWDTLLKYQKCTKKLEYTFEEMEKNDWEVIVND